MHTRGDTDARGAPVWQASPEVAGAIKRAAHSFAHQDGVVAVLGRNELRSLTGLRVAICDDSALFLGGLAAALADLGVEICLQRTTVEGLENAIVGNGAEALIIDISQPPTHTVEGLLAAQRIRHDRPGFPTLLLSSDVTVEGHTALSLLKQDGRALGFVNRDRLQGGPDLQTALTRVVQGGTIIDSDVVSTLLTAAREGSALTGLSMRELQTLELVAQGMTNAAIARRMFLSPKTVEANIASLFAKLDLPVEDSVNRRVLATLRYLRAARSTRANEIGSRARGA